ncbi:MAG: hypothetical protein APF83_04795 [Lutibacter sp. BRH_c52]|nr:MAG: hypothetical protein APF83_04795 [Lutibacter sp. BRH_c52]
MNTDYLFDNLNKKRIQELALIDCFASALSVGSIFTENGVDFQAITPEMEEAFNLQYPNLEIKDLINYNDEQLSGIINGWKGKLFEVNLRDGLNNGDNIGGISLDFNQSAELVSNPTNEGFDLIIVDDETGQIVSELQAKATNSFSYIKETIEKYPDYDIITSEEAANQLGSDFDYVTELNGVNIHNSGITNEELTNEIENVFDDDGFNIFEFSFVLIPLVRNGHKYLAGSYTVEKAVTSMTNDVTKSAIAIAGGSAIVLLGLGTGSGIVATIAIRMAMGKPKNDIWGDLDRYKKSGQKADWGNLKDVKRLNS